MANTDSADSAAEAKRQVAKHELLDKSGAVTKKMEEATGYRYTDSRGGGTFEFNWTNATPGSAAVMLAIFGAKTLATNTASGVRNADEPGTPAEEVEAIRERFEQLENGVWREAGEGREVGYDKDVLAEAIVAAKEAAGQSADKAAIRQRIEDDPKYRRAAMQVEEVATEYYKRKPKKPGKTLADI
jgi:hypothetical protein